MAENDYFSSINPKSYGTVSGQSTSDAPPKAPEYFLFNNPNLSDKDKKYLAQLTQDRANIIKSTQEDIFAAQTAPTQKDREAMAKFAELEQKEMACIEAEMNSVTNKGTLKDAITNCKDPVKLNQLLTQRKEYAQHLVEMQKTLASVNPSELSEEEKKKDYALMDFYKNNIG